MLTSVFSLKRWMLIGGLMLIVLTGCANTPIDTGNPVAFKHRTGVFEMQVPKSWKQTQDQVDTEALAAFSDPTGNAEIIGYTGLLDHTFTNDEGLTVVPQLIENLLNAPADLAVTDKQVRADGAFVVSLTFTRNTVKRTGQAIFRQGNLALYGTIASGPQADWSTLSAALQPYVDSFKVSAESVQGTYFEPLQDSHYALVVPVGWEHVPGSIGQQVRSPNGKLLIAASQLVVTDTASGPSLTDQVVRRAAQLLGSVDLQTSETLPNGQLKVILTQPQHRITGYAEIKDGALIAVFFDAPADQADAYQPIIDFMYSTFVTGKA
jgi:hypothetical protein